eukprot:768698-Hanusia_phi.AAC.3
MTPPPPCAPMPEGYPTPPLPLPCSPSTPQWMEDPTFGDLVTFLSASVDPPRAQTPPGHHPWCLLNPPHPTHPTLSGVSYPGT